VIFREILDREPVPAIRLNPDLPPKLEDVINKALEKDRELRYQVASEMRADLKWLKRETESRTAYRLVRVGRGRTGKRLSGGPTAVASIRFLACAHSISVIERSEGGRSSCSGWQETLEGSGSAAVVLVVVAIWECFYFRSRQTTHG